MYARAGAGPPLIVTLSKNVDSPSEIDVSCGTPTRPTAPPGRALWRAVIVDSSWPTHSSTEWAPRPSRQLPDPLHCLVPPLAHHVSRAEVPRERDPVIVVTQDDDLLGSEAARREHAAKTDSAVADDRDCPTGTHAGAQCRVVTGRHHVRQGQERRHERGVWLNREPDEGPIRLRNAHGFALSAIDAIVAVPSPVQARGVHSLPAEDACSV